ncbi:N-acetyl-lysine deacetylase [Candidatus Methanoperedenaceae archaeon GB37]|nr:N-acetyl-lysine deacetylase [Candidatus Methanoperedenaceae archaeon GB37]
MVQDDKREIIQLLLTLLSIPSPSGEEMPLLQWIETYLYNCDFKTYWQKVTDNRANLCAYRGHPQYLIATHVDTVPALGSPLCIFTQN